MEFSYEDGEDDGDLEDDDDDYYSDDDDDLEDDDGREVSIE